jgi:transcriptional/translational regulatory protein YebC/TACO1
VLVPAEGTDEEELLLAAADAGADDVELDGSSFVITGPPETLSSVREAVEASGFAMDSAELAMLPKATVAIESEATARQLLRLIEGLEESDDVQGVYANFDIPERVLEAVAS